MQAERRKRVRISPCRWALFVLLALIVAALDLWSKQAAFGLVGLGERPLPVVRGFFYLSHVRNEGGVFGVAQGRAWFFAAFSLAAVVFIVWMFLAHGGASRMLTIALALVFGGAIGNLYDRIALRYVRDFLDFRFWGWPYPTFNVADAAITAGVGMLIVLSFWWGGEQPRQAEEENPPGKPGKRGGKKKKSVGGGR